MFFLQDWIFLEIFLLFHQNLVFYGYLKNKKKYVTSMSLKIKKVSDYLLLGAGEVQFRTKE